MKAFDHDELGLERLTPRERDCLRLVARHLQSKEIARRLNISEHTVDGYLREACRRLGASNRREAARRFADHEASIRPLNGAGAQPARVALSPDAAPPCGR